MSAALANAASLTSKPFGMTADGKRVTRYLMGASNGITVEFIGYGGIVTAIINPDRQGPRATTVLGFPTLRDYETKSAEGGLYLGLQASAASLAGQADPKSKLGQLRRFPYDTAGSANPSQMTALKSLVSASQILFGTDFPFHNSGDIIQGLKVRPFDEAELRGINRQNALVLLPKYA